MNITNLVPDALIVPAEIMEELEQIDSFNSYNTEPAEIADSLVLAMQTITNMETAFFGTEMSEMKEITEAEGQELETSKPTSNVHDKNNNEDVNVPAKYWPSVAFTSSVGAGRDFSAADLESIPVGMQNAAITQNVLIASGPSNIENAETTPEAKASGLAMIREVLARGKITSEELHLWEKIGETKDDSEVFDISNSSKLSKAERSRLYKIIAGANAKERVFRSVNKRISRKLLLTERARAITVVCETTGIVSQDFNVPSIHGFALVYSSPFAEIKNCRGMAQQGLSYLQKLDTQVLAGILIVLASSYNLFRWNDSDSGAYKNAVLRTAESSALIASILIIEGCIHSQNYRFLPRLSFQMDTLAETVNTKAKLYNWNRLISKAIAEPDTSELKNNSFPQNPIKPSYQSYWSETKHSFLKNAEEKDAKKILRKDKKEGKIIIASFCERNNIPFASKQMFFGILESLEATAPKTLNDIINRLESKYGNDPDARKLIELFARDRSILQIGLAELSTPSKEEKDDAMEHLEDSEGSEAEGNKPVPSTESNESSDSEFPKEDYELEESDIKISESRKPYTENDAPEALSFVARVLWAKKMNISEGLAKRTAIQNTNVPSVATYVPGDKKQKLGEI